MTRILFAGTAPFAVPTLRVLAQAGFSILAVVSQPDRPQGRKMQLLPTPVRAAAEELGLPVLQPPRINESGFVSTLAALRPDLLVVVAYGQILRPPLLGLPPLGCINLHGSLLPLLRGAAPVQWSIIRGYEETGVTTMQMDAGLDTGPILLQASTGIGPEETAGELAARLAVVGADLMRDTLTVLASTGVTPTPQDDSRATLAPPLRRIDGFICWSWRAREICNRVRGCNPWPGCSALLNGQEVKLWRARAIPSLSGRPGELLSTEPLVLAAGEESVELMEVQPAGGARMSGEVFARGRRLSAGERFDEMPLPAGEARHI